MGYESQKNVLDDNLEAENDYKSKPRKSLIKKSSGKETSPNLGFENGVQEIVRDVSHGAKSAYSGTGKRKRVEESSGEKRKGKNSREKKLKLNKSGGVSNAGKRGNEVDQEELKELWDIVAGGDPEDDQDGAKTVGDEEDDEIKDLFKVGKKKNKSEKSAHEISLLVESVMAELEVVAEEDAELNRQSKPAINKLTKLPLLTDVLSKKQLQQEFLDHGVLTLLKNWLEPLPDGSLPSINIRAAILKILTDYPIGLDQYDRKEQLKKSGLGRVIMFLSKSDEETTGNRKLARDLVDKWSRCIFNKSTRFEDMKNFEEERSLYRRAPVKKPVNKASGMQCRYEDLDLVEFSQVQKTGQSSARRQLTSRPEPMLMDFVVRPQSKFDPILRARAKPVEFNERQEKIIKKLEQLKASKKKSLQASKISVNGRGMIIDDQVSRMHLLLCKPGGGSCAAGRRDRLNVKCQP